MTNEFNNKYGIKSNLGIFKKFLFSFLIIAISPIIFFGIISLITINTTSNLIFKEVKTSIDQQAKITIELQASLVAKSVSRFLKQRENELHLLSELPRSNSTYLDFSKKHKSSIWIKQFNDSTGSSIHTFIPMYKEISFVDINGNEIIKILNNEIESNSLKNVSNPQNTTYKSENYFNKTVNNKKGQIYVSHLTGFYISKREQLGNASTIETAKSNVYYNGVIRFALKVYSKNKFIGIIMLALDQRILMEFTQHILPNKIKQTVFPIYETGNYAFMFDDDGWIITHPKLWDIRGVDKNGNWIPSYSNTTDSSIIKKGFIPFNLDDAGFIHPNYPFVSEEIRIKNSGVVTTINVGGIAKLMAYAPIIYSTGEYNKYGVFGGITIGANLEQFHRPAISILNKLLETSTLLRKNIYVIILVTFFIVALLSWFISLHFTVPILKITKGAKSLAKGVLTEPIEITREDEIGELASSFNYMSSELRQSKAQLVKSFEDLKKSKTEIEIYTKDLEFQIKIFKTILNISNLIGHSFNIDKILQTIIKNSVVDIGFDRAILYLIDDEGQYLECKEIYGFSDKKIKSAKNSKYNLRYVDCIETRVVKSGKIIFVENFDDYKEATKFDTKIHKVSNTNSFVFVPLLIRENVIGILGADKFRTKNKIKSTEINSLQILANQASRVIENTQLYTALVKERDFVEDILKYMSNGIVTTDAKGNITSINQAAENILNISKKDALGKNTSSVFKNQKIVLEQIENAVSNKEFNSDFNVEFISNSKTKYINISISPIGKNLDSETGLITVLQDVTQKKEMDNHLQRIDRLASLGRFAAGIAHEIRNPLTGISLFLDDFHDKLFANPEISTVIEQAINEIGRLENLVNELLDYASPKNTMKKKLVDMNELILSTINFTSKQCMQFGIMVTTNFDSDLPQIVISPEKIRQALLNIILNAIQVLPNGGELKISTLSVHNLNSVNNKLIMKDLNYIKIVIEDSGPGVPNNERATIFEPFFSNKIGGTGLGLSITQSIIEENNGIIICEKSELGGAEFSIFLPVNKN